MALDRFIRWMAPAPEWGEPDIGRLAAVARDYLGSGWEVEVAGPFIVCTSRGERESFHLLSEIPEKSGLAREMSQSKRAFEVYHDAHTSVMTRQADAYTNAVADGYAKVIARWWNGTIEKG